jgi:hypothetical protein
MPKITRETLRQMIAEEITRSTKPEPKEVKITAEQLRSIILQEVNSLNEQEDAEGTKIVSTKEDRELRDENDKNISAALATTATDNLPKNKNEMIEWLSLAEAPQIGIVVAAYADEQSENNLSPARLARMASIVEKKASKILDDGNDATFDALRVDAYVRLARAGESELARALKL